MKSIKHFYLRRFKKLHTDLIDEAKDMFNYIRDSLRHRDKKVEYYVRFE
jgi:hypothetical protein